MIDKSEFMSEMLNMITCMLILLLRSRCHDMMSLIPKCDDMGHASSMMFSVCFVWSWCIQNYIIVFIGSSHWSIFELKKTTWIKSTLSWLKIMKWRSMTTLTVPGCVLRYKVELDSLVINWQINCWQTKPIILYLLKHT